MTYKYLRHTHAANDVIVLDAVDRLNAMQTKMQAIYASVSNPSDIGPDDSTQGVLHLLGDQIREIKTISEMLHPNKYL